MDDLIQRLRVEPTASQFLRTGDLVESLVAERKEAAARIAALELRHLLEMAARALGYAFIKPADGYDGRLGLEIGDNPMRTQSWNPYADDGDSARMRSALGVSVNFTRSPTSSRISGVRCFADKIGHYMQMHEHIEHVSDHNNDRDAALRLCALRVAAMIGEGME